MKAIDLTNLIHSSLIESYNKNNECDIQGICDEEQAQLNRNSRIFHIAIIMGVISGVIVTVFVVGKFSEPLLLSFLLVIFSCIIPVIISVKFFFKETYYQESRFVSLINNFRENYYTDLSDVILTEELIRNNLVLMARRVLFANSLLEYVRSTGWANQKTLQRFEADHVNSKQILSRALDTMDKFGLEWNKRSIFDQAKNG